MENPRVFTLCSSVRVNVHGWLLFLLQIIKKHDKLTGFTTRAWVLARLDASGFLSHSLDGFLGQL